MSLTLKKAEEFNYTRKQKRHLYNNKNDFLFLYDPIFFNINPCTPKYVSGKK